MGTIDLDVLDIQPIAKRSWQIFKSDKKETQQSESKEEEEMKKWDPSRTVNEWVKEKNKEDDMDENVRVEKIDEDSDWYESATTMSIEDYEKLKKKQEQ